MWLRHRLVLVAVGLALGLSVAWGHSGLVTEHLSSDGVVAVCAAVFETGLAVATAGVLASIVAMRRLGGGWLVMAAQGFAPTRSVPTRAGPEVLQVFRR